MTDVAVYSRPQSMLLDEEDIPKDILCFLFIFTDEALQKRIQEIATKFKVQAKSSCCFGIGIQFYLGLLKKYGVDIKTLDFEDFGQKCRVSYLKIYSIYKKCGKLKYACSICNNLVALELHRFIQEFTVVLLFLPFGFLETSMTVYFHFQKSWNLCVDCFPFPDILPGNFSIKPCIKNPGLQALKDFGL